MGLSVTCSTTIDECYVVDVERTDEACASTSELSYGVVPFIAKSKTPSVAPVALVCPTLGTFELPLLINQRGGARPVSYTHLDVYKRQTLLLHTFIYIHIKFTVIR